MVGSLWITTLNQGVIGWAALKGVISFQISWFSSRYFAEKVGVVVIILLPLLESVTEATTGDCTPPLVVKALLKAFLILRASKAPSASLTSTIWRSDRLVVVFCGVFVF